MKYSTINQLKLIFPNSIVQEISRSEYEIELDFAGNDKEQINFFKCLESQLKQGEIITFTFNNEILPSANMVSISSSEQQVEYQVSVVFSRNRWKEIKSIDEFVPQFVQLCQENNLDVKLEGEDDYFCYLSLTKSVKPEMSIASRLNQISLELVEKVCELL